MLYPYLRRLTVLAGLALLSLSAHAELTANVGISSNYVFRGFTQSDDSLAIQGGIDFNQQGFFAGAWASTIKCPTGSPCIDNSPNEGNGLEVDLYAGYNFKLDKDWSIDVGFITYEYTDGDMDANRELFVGANYKGFSLTYYIGNDTSAGDPDYNYLDFKVKVELQDKIFFHGHYGRLDPDRGSSVNDASIGVSKELWGMNFALTLTAEDLTDKEEFFITITKRFDIK